MSAYAMQPQPSPPQARSVEGVTVIGEAVRSVHPETAEFLIEVTSSAPTAAHALREVQARTTQIAQAAVSLGVHQSDLQTISMNVHNAWAALGQQSWGAQNFANPASAYGGMMSALPMFAGMPSAVSGPLGIAPQQLQAAFMPFGSAPGIQPAAIQPDVQFGQWLARNTIRVRVKDTARVGEVVDTVARAGANILGGFSFQPSDEAQARRAVLESATKDARARAEALATAAGKQLGDPVAVSEEVANGNGSLRSAASSAFGAGPGSPGHLEYYARVSATFRLQ